MTSQEERVVAMVRDGAITEEDAHRLIGALRTRPRLWAIHMAYKPMELLSTRTARIAAIIITALSILVARPGVRFDGALDLHRVVGPLRWNLVLLDAANAVLLTATVLWLAGRLAARGVRWIDFVLAVAIARAPQVVAGVATYLIMPDPRMMQEAVVATLTRNAPLPASLYVSGILLPPFLIWFVVLLYQGFRTSSGLHGARAGVTFTLGIIAAEIVTKIVLFAASATVLATTLHAQTPLRPQTPQPPFPYQQEEVTFRNDAANLRFAGTLTRPSAVRPVPAVLLITGSGAQDRDETIFDHKPFAVLADYLTRQGVAVLRVDDRGVGGSDRGPDGVTSSDFAGDVRAGVAYLRNRSEIDAMRIGLVGHSEGAMLAAMVAADSADVAFIVMIAGTGVPGDEILYSQAAAMIRGIGGSDAVIAWDRSLRERVFSAIKAETDGWPNAARRDALLAELAAQTPSAPGVPNGAQTRKQAEALLAAMSAPWLRFFIAYDPRPTLARVRVPVLAVGGDKDVQVPAKENLTEIEQAIKKGGNANVTTALMPGLNHLLQTSTTGLPAEYARIEETIAPAALAIIANWIAQQK